MPLAASQIRLGDRQCPALQGVGFPARFSSQRAPLLVFSAPESRAKPFRA